MKRKRIEDIIDFHGRLIYLPTQKALRKKAMEYIATRFLPSIEYFEDEVDEIIEATHLSKEKELIKQELLKMEFLSINRRKNRYTRRPAA